jgi:alginate O-acetyltransferase complex protein AlgJ
MLDWRRRYFGILTFLLLASPLAAGLVMPDNPENIRKREAREPASPPTVPRDFAALTALPRNVDAYLKDHFGLREKMIRLHRELLRPVFLAQANNTPARTVTGSSGRIYTLLDDMVTQSAGLVFRERQVREAADLAAAMRDALKERGIGFLVAVPPNSSTIYQDDLPSWARNPGRKTEYDLFLEKLQPRNVKAVDLRPALNAARLEGPTYFLNDAHWNVRGTVAGYNAVVVGDGHPEWRIEPSSALGPLVQRKGGDIARAIGIEDSANEMTESFALPITGTGAYLSGGALPDDMITTDKAGPTILVIGDSFTTPYFAYFLTQHVRRAIWIHHHRCGFDWGLIDKLRPDEVWWMPVERFLICDAGQHPIGLREASTVAGGLKPDLR